MRHKKTYDLAVELINRSERCTVSLNTDENGKYSEFVFDVSFVTNIANLEIIRAKDFIRITLVGHGSLVASLNFTDAPDFKIGPEHKIKFDKAHSAGLKNIKIMNKMLKRELEVWPDEGSENS